MTFLIVEDNPKTAKLLKQYLHADGIEIITAEDSFTAMKILLTTHVDQILSDLDLPYRDGLHFARAVKDDERTRLIPFRIYSSSKVNDEDIELASRYGVEYIIPENDPEKIAMFAKTYLI